MTKKVIFISSVQKEFSAEREALRQFLTKDPLLGRFFDVFLFEAVPALDQPADTVYISEVDRADIYVGLLGNDYGYARDKNFSPVEREFNRASVTGKIRFVFIKGIDDSARDPRMQSLIQKAGVELVRRRFNTIPELVGAVYASCVKYLEEQQLIRTGPFDSSPCLKAGLEDLDDEKIMKFLLHARRARGMPLAEDSTSQEVLTHLNLLEHGKPTNAAVLLFGKQPQRFLISSEVKCAHFHGLDVAKPIPSYQVYKGTAFDCVDQSVDFVMSKINLWVGTRKDGPQVPVEYEIPREVVAEGIVNAVAHRDYSSNGSVQVMLFADRLEIWNPGALPLSITLAKLRQPHGSVPANPLLAEALYLTKYIERMGTGTRDMIRRCREAGLQEPEFSQTDGFVTTIWRSKVVSQSAGEVTGEVTGEVRRLLKVLAGEMKRTDLQKALNLRHEDSFRETYLVPALESKMIEMTVPSKPKSSKQRYRLTAKGLLYSSKEENNNAL